MAFLIEGIEAKSHQGQIVQIKGHIHLVRDLGNIVFLKMRDQSGIIQAVAQDALLETARRVTPETAVIIEGAVVLKPNAVEECEVHITKLTILSEPPTSLPIEINKPNKMDSLSINSILDYRPLSLRNEKAKAIFKIEAVLCAAFREFLNRERFVEIHSSKIVSTGTEGGAQLFKVDYFGKPAYLAQSPQFYKQIMVGVFERVFEIGPVYRAEEHDTTRHINEYISMDLEMGFIQSEQDIMVLEVRLLAHMFESLKSQCAKELSLYGVQVPAIADIPQITLSEAMDLLTKKFDWKKDSPNKDAELDLDPDGERLLCQYFDKAHGSQLVFVTHYPHKIRPFYAMPIAEGVDNAAPKLSHSFDLLFKGAEITTGGQRIHQASMLESSMQERGLNAEKFADYLQCFKYGMPPHGGLAIGLERLVKQLLDLPNIKLASLFPRDRNRITP